MHCSEGVIRDPPGREDKKLVENQRENIMYFIPSHSLDSGILGQYNQVLSVLQNPSQAHCNSNKS